MSESQGRFVWYELMTTDPTAAAAFYGSVVGWGVQDMGTPGMDYRFFTVGGIPVAGLMAQPDEVRKAGAPPAWMGYVAVDDVDRAAGAVAAGGGTVHRPATDIPGVGRFAVVTDPQMAAFMLFTPLPRETPPPMPAPGSPGTIGWHELYATDWEKVFPFYGSLFGWTKDQAVDMGPMGTYQLFALSGGGPATGGMWNKPAAIPATFWLYYFNVEAIDAAVERVTAGGGKILNGPMEVPGGSFIVQGQDPQGAMFALTAPRR